MNYSEDPGLVLGHGLNYLGCLRVVFIITCLPGQLILISGLFYLRYRDVCLARSEAKHEENVKRKVSEGEWGGGDGHLGSEGGMITRPPCRSPSYKKQNALTFLIHDFWVACLALAPRRNAHYLTIDA